MSTDTTRTTNQPTSLGEVTNLPELPADFLAEAKAEGAEVVPYAPDQLAAFIQGQITLGDLEGIPKEAQYQMANKGHQLLEEGKLDDAKVVFEGLLALDPFDAYFLTALGSIALRTEQYDAADHFYSRALEINPFSIAAWAHRGETRVHKGLLLEASEDLKKAMDLDLQGEDPIAQRARLVAQTVADQLKAQQKSV
ncbi:MAG: hypothetical protein CMH56_09490 [Myxococcales bacterium]|nr:hypothetical protein [Myxococcales bacterium]|tara:strand:- start:998 stop:1585 length:588 start_codon:yes stop_codon:yes gene_type:complete